MAAHTLIPADAVLKTRHAVDSLISCNAGPDGWTDITAYVGLLIKPHDDHFYTCVRIDQWFIDNKLYHLDPEWLDAHITIGKYIPQSCGKANWCRQSGRACKSLAERDRNKLKLKIRQSLDSEGSPSIYEISLHSKDASIFNTLDQQLVAGSKARAAPRRALGDPRSLVIHLSIHSW